MARISIAIMHAPWATERVPHVGALSRALGVPEGLSVVTDDDRHGVWPTARRAWLRAIEQASSATHVAVMQDDVRACPNLATLLDAAIDANPHEVVSLFSMSRGFVREARERGLSWAWGPDAAYGQAMVMPRELASSFLAWEQEHVRANFPHDDNRVAAFARMTGRGIYVTCPNLVDHAEPARSLLGHNNRARVAQWVADGSHVDWSRGLLDPVRASATVNVRSILARPPTGALPRCAPSENPALPREVIAGARADRWLRYGLPAALAGAVPLRLHGRVVGFACPREIEPGLWRAGPLWVDPPCRGRGVLRAFYDAHPERAWFASIERDNIASIAAHERMGFVRVGSHSGGGWWRREPLQSQS